MLVRFVKLGELANGWVVYWDRKCCAYVKVPFGGRFVHKIRRFMNCFRLLLFMDLAMFVYSVYMIDNADPSPFAMRVVAVMLGVLIGALMSYLLIAGIPFSAKEEASVVEVAQCLKNNPMLAWSMIIGRPLLVVSAAYGCLGLFIYCIFNEYIDSIPWLHEGIGAFLTFWGPLFSFMLWSVMVVLIAFLERPVCKLWHWLKSWFVNVR